jgi:hypothetical protein
MIGNTVIDASKRHEGATMSMAQGDMSERPCDQGSPQQVESLGNFLERKHQENMAGVVNPTPPQDRDNDYNEKI